MPRNLPPRNSFTTQHNRNLATCSIFSTFQPFNLSTSRQSINHDFSTFQVLKSLYLLLIQSFLSMKLCRQELYYIGQSYCRIIYWVFGCYWGDYLCVWLCVVFVMRLNQNALEWRQLLLSTTLCSARIRDPSKSPGRIYRQRPHLQWWYGHRCAKLPQLQP